MRGTSGGLRIVFLPRCVTILHVFLFFYFCSWLSLGPCRWIISQQTANFLHRPPSLLPNRNPSLDLLVPRLPLSHHRFHRLWRTPRLHPLRSKLPNHRRTPRELLQRPGPVVVPKRLLHRLLSSMIPHRYVFPRIRLFLPPTDCSICSQPSSKPAPKKSRARPNSTPVVSEAEVDEEDDEEAEEESTVETVPIPAKGKAKVRSYTLLFYLC